MDSKERKSWFFVNGWQNDVYLFSAKALCERIEQDSKTKIEWIAPLSEIVKTCNSEGFPEEYAKKIKIMILNYCACEFCPSNVVYRCFNDLQDSEEDSLEAKKNYMVSVVNSVAKNYRKTPIYEQSEVYEQICEEWVKAKMSRIDYSNRVDFRTLINELYDDFDRLIDFSEGAGILSKSCTTKIQED